MRFRLDEHEYRVEEVLDQRYGPEHVFFKLRADNGNTYILRRETSVPEGASELVSFREHGERQRYCPSGGNEKPEACSRGEGCARDLREDRTAFYVGTPQQFAAALPLGTGFRIVRKLFSRSPKARSNRSGTRIPPLPCFLLALEPAPSCAYCHFERQGPGGTINAVHRDAVRAGIRHIGELSGRMDGYRGRR